MASLSDVLSTIQNGVVALNNLTIQMKGSLLNIFGQLSTDATNIATNTANIATNTADISSTIGEISALNGLQINGSMEVSQELGGTATSTNGAYIMDGWIYAKNGTMVCSAAQTASSTQFPGFSNYLNISVGTAQVSLGAGDFTVIVQRIEGYRVARLNFGTANAQPITIGFWTAHHRIGLYSGAIRNNAFTRSYAFSYTQAVADTPQFNTVTIPGDTTGTWLTTNGTGLSICFAMACGSTYLAAAGAWSASGLIGATGQINGVAATSDVFRITGVIVLQGDKAPTAAQSPHIMRPFDAELAICQRYYEKSYDYTSAISSATLNGAPYWIGVAAATGNAINLYASFTTSKRAVPTMTWYSPIDGTSGKIYDPINGVNLNSNNYAIGEHGSTVYAIIGTDTSQLTGHWVADARL